MSYNNNRRHNNNRRQRHDDDECKYNSSNRTIDSLLSFDDNIVFEEDVKNNLNNDNRNRNNNNQNQGNNNKNWNNGNSKKQNVSNNALAKIISNEGNYDRDDMLNILIKKNGLIDMISDIKKAKKKNDKKPYYISMTFRDIVFASALPEAISKLSKKDDYGESQLSKKDINVLLDEILIFLGNSYDQRLVQRYGEESVESMRKAYTNVLYKFNKKKVKKFKKDISNMPESMAKQIIILTAGEDLRSIYRLLKFIYSESDSYSFDKKTLCKILKICYGKDNMNEVIKYLMLEKANNAMSKSAEDVWVTIDKLIRDELEDMSKRDIEKIISDYISERKRQEKNGIIPRRFGNRKSIHPDDYPKLTKVCDKIEEEDFSIITYLRK